MNRRNETDRQEGSQLLEVMIALAVFAVGALGFLPVFQTMTRAADDARKQDSVQLAFRNATAQLRSVDFDTLHSNYQNRVLEAPGLKGDDGNVAKILVTCFLDETNLPLEFGPILDIDGDGTLLTVDASTNYKLLPVRLSLTWATQYGLESREFYTVLSGSL